MSTPSKEQGMLTGIPKYQLFLLVGGALLLAGALILTIFFSGGTAIPAVTLLIYLAYGAGVASCLGSLLGMLWKTWEAPLVLELPKFELNLDPIKLDKQVAATIQVESKQLGNGICIPQARLTAFVAAAADNGSDSLHDSIGFLQTDAPLAIGTPQSKVSAIQTEPDSWQFSAVRHSANQRSFFADKAPFLAAGLLESRRLTAYGSVPRQPQSPGGMVSSVAGSPALANASHYSSVSQSGDVARALNFSRSSQPAGDPDDWQNHTQDGHNSTYQGGGPDDWDNHSLNDSFVPLQPPQQQTTLVF